MTTIFVMTHKEFDDAVLPNSGYQVIKVGDNLDNSICQYKKYISDRTGDSIAEQNPYYCELTGIYWVWKNMQESIDIVGFNHYRRYFMSHKSIGWRDKNSIISIDEIEQILKKYTVILPFETKKAKNMFRLVDTTSVIEQDIYMGIVENILLNYYPDAIPVWKYLTRGSSMIWKNMFITHRKLFEEYCEWLFGILKEFDAEFEKTGIDKLPRIDGFLAEYLTPTFFMTKVPENKIKHLEIFNPNENFTVIKQFIKNKTIIMKLIREIK